jgi:hypothetical protein
VAAAMYAEIDDHCIKAEDDEGQKNGGKKKGSFLNTA